MPGVSTVHPVTISYFDLKDKRKDLSEKIKEGFGPDGLGIITVSYVPEFSLLRQKLLELTPRLVALPEDVKHELEDRNSRFNNGWSFAKDNVDDDMADLTKGSFFANPLLDTPTSDPDLMKRYPSYCRPNRWPTKAFPELEVAFKALGKLIVDVGLLVAYHCDRYVSQQKAMPDSEGLEEILKYSKCHKGRLIYYYPTKSKDLEDSPLSSWCGWHSDWGSLTGLTTGIFTKSGEKVPCPDNAAGLYIKTRTNEFVRVVFGEDEIAYQVGETTEILSKGLLCATPHSVRAPVGESAECVARSTFVLFMQPNWDEVLKFPEEVRYHSELVSPKENLEYGEYTERIVGKYLKQV